MVFRKRPPRHRRPFQPIRRPLRRAVLRQLRIANELLDAGKMQQAAEQFEQLATKAAARDYPQAAQLFLRAGRARLEANQTAVGLAHVNQAVMLFAQNGQVDRLYKLRPRLIEALKQHGLEREAIELDRAIHDILDKNPQTQTHLSTSQPKLGFPAKCKFCGANLRPDEMEILDQMTGVCGYCGSINHVS